MGANNHLTTIPKNAETRADGGEKTVYVVIGVNQWHEDGFEVIKAFDDHAEAANYSESDQPGEDAKYGWETYYVTEVPHVREE